MAHCLILTFLAVHVQRILACIELLYADQSLMLACAKLEIYLYNQPQINRMYPQSGKCLLLAWSKDIMVLPDPKIS